MNKRKKTREKTHTIAVMCDCSGRPRAAAVRLLGFDFLLLCSFFNFSKKKKIFNNEQADLILNARTYTIYFPATSDTKTYMQQISPHNKHLTYFTYYMLIFIQTQSTCIMFFNSILHAF